MTAYDKYQRDIGREEGREEGRQEGRQENQIQVALEMLRDGFDVGVASRYSKLEPNFILEEERKAKEGA